MYVYFMKPLQNNGTWGTMYISRDDYEPHCEFHNDPVTDDCWLQNRYKWVYKNFGVLENEDEFDPDVYKRNAKRSTRCFIIGRYGISCISKKLYCHR